jgi:hypothetical protein
MKRIRNVLRAHVAASARILENKISDAGPTNQRIDPHVLSKARALLENVHDVEVIKDRKGTPWYYLCGTPTEILEPRLKELQALHDETQSKQFTLVAQVRARVLGANLGYPSLHAANKSRNVSLCRMA